MKLVSFLLVLSLGLAAVLSACEPPHTPPIPETESDPVEQQPPPIGYDQDEITPDRDPIPVYREVVNYVDFIEEAQEQELQEVVEQQFVVSAMNLLQEALADMTVERYLEAPEEQPGLPEPQPSLAPDDPQQEIVPPREAMEQELQLLRSHIDRMDSTTVESEFSTELKTAARAATELLMIIQQENFPRFTVEVREVAATVDALDPAMSLDEQRREVMDYLTTTADVLDAMERQIRTEIRGRT